MEEDSIGKYEKQISSHQLYKIKRAFERERVLSFEERSNITAISDVIHYFNMILVI